MTNELAPWRIRKLTRFSNVLRHSIMYQRKLIVAKAPTGYFYVQLVLGCKTDTSTDFEKIFLLSSRKLVAAMFWVSRLKSWANLAQLEIGRRLSKYWCASACMFLAISLLNFFRANKILLDTTLLNFLCFLLYLAFIVTVQFRQILKGT